MVRVLLPAEARHHQESDAPQSPVEERTEATEPLKEGSGTKNPAHQSSGENLLAVAAPPKSASGVPSHSSGSATDRSTPKPSGHKTAKKRPRSPDSKPPAKETMTGGHATPTRRHRRPSSGRDAENSPGYVNRNDPAAPFPVYNEQPLENEPPTFDNLPTAISVRPAVEENDDQTAATSSFAETLKQERGLEIVEQEGDGNCLFRAVGLQVYGDAEQHREVRERCLDFMERDPEHFAPFVVADNDDDDNKDSNNKDAFAAYCARKRHDGVHGNNPEIQAISELYNRPVEVFIPERGATPLNIFQTAYKTTDAPIRLSYHDGNHYNAVIDPLVPTAGLGLGLPGLQPGLADKLQVAKAVTESDHLADEAEYERALKASEEDELHRAMKESASSVG